MIDILDIIDSDAEVDTKVYDSFQDYIQNNAETGEVKDKSNFSIPDYNMYYNESHLNKCDGVVVYVKHSISVIESLVQEFLEDDERPGQPVEVITEDKVALVEELVLSDRRLKTLIFCSLQLKALQPQDKLEWPDLIRPSCKKSHLLFSPLRWLFVGVGIASSWRASGASLGGSVATAASPGRRPAGPEEPPFDAIAVADWRPTTGAAAPKKATTASAAPSTVCCLSPYRHYPPPLSLGGKVSSGELCSGGTVAPKWCRCDRPSPMFPFRSRRSNLTRRLSKATRRGVAGCSPQADAVAALLKKLQDAQLETLFKAVESRGREPTGCVLLPFKEEPHLLCCQTWRWPDLHSGEELRRLPSCRSKGDKVYVCCNPYHWSRICVPVADTKLKDTSKSFIKEEVLENTYSANINCLFLLLQNKTAHHHLTVELMKKCYDLKRRESALLVSIGEASEYKGFL
nr:unnamed protein product [Callosobruchus analis]